MSDDGLYGRNAVSLGARLRAAREAKNLSLEDIANLTRLRAEHLRAIEDDDLARLPEPVYARNYVRAYARAVGIDAEEVARAFDRAAPVAPAPRGSRLAYAPLLAAVLALAAAGAGVYYLVVTTLQASVPAPPAAVEAPADEGVARSVFLTVTSTPPGAVVQLDRRRLDVTPLERYPVSAGAGRELRVELQGFMPAVRTLDLRDNQTVAVTLEPVPVEPEPAPVEPGTAPAEPVPPAQTVPPAGGRPTSPPATGPATRPPAAPPAASPPVTAPPAATRPATAAPSATVSLAVRGRSWLRVTNARGQVLFEGIPAVGSTLSYPGPVRVRAGNAGAVIASVGGTARGPLGPLGEVAETRLP